MGKNEKSEKSLRSKQLKEWWIDKILATSPITMFAFGVLACWAIYSGLLQPAINEGYLIQINNVAEKNNKLEATILNYESQQLILKDSIKNLTALGKYLKSYNIKDNEHVSILGNNLSIEYRVSSIDHGYIDINIDTCLYSVNVLDDAKDNQRSHNCYIYLLNIRVDEGTLIPVVIFEKDYLLHFTKIHKDSTAVMELFLVNY